MSEEPKCTKCGKAMVETEATLDEGTLTVVYKCPDHREEILIEVFPPD